MRLIFISRASISSVLTSQHLLINARPPAKGLQLALAETSHHWLGPNLLPVRGDTPVPRSFTEGSWNNPAIEAVKTKGSAAGPGAFFKASKSKTLAEMAAWEFVAPHKSERSLGISSFSRQTSFHFILFPSQILQR